MQQQNFHEILTEESFKSGSSNREFGLVVGAIIFIIGGIRCYLHEFSGINIFLITLGTILLGCAIFFPSYLKFSNMIWMKLGGVLFKFVNPILMSLLYFFFFVPIGIIMKLFGYDPLHAKFDKNAISYWVNKPKNELDTPMKYQF